MRHIKLVIFASPHPATTCDVRMHDDVWEAHVANARKANVTIADDGTRVVVIVSRDDASTCLVMQELRSCARCDEAPVVSGDVMCATCRAVVLSAQRAEGLVCLACPTPLCSERDGDSDYCEACRADPDDVCVVCASQPRLAIGDGGDGAHCMFCLANVHASIGRTS